MWSFLVGISLFFLAIVDSLYKNIWLICWFIKKSFATCFIEHSKVSLSEHFEEIQLGRMTMIGILTVFPLTFLWNIFHIFTLDSTVFFLHIFHMKYQLESEQFSLSLFFEIFFTWKTIGFYTTDMNPIYIWKVYCSAFVIWSSTLDEDMPFCQIK